MRQIRRLTIGAGLAIAFALATEAAHAEQSAGNAALALAAVVGEQSPTVSRGEKTLLTHFLNGETNVPLRGVAQSIAVNADKIVCRMGDVDIGMHSCELTFGTVTVTKSDRTGQLLLATMQENGVKPDGAAGTIYFTATQVACVVRPAQVESHDGGGAKCTFTSP